MSLYDAVQDLPVEIEGYALEGLELQARADFLRRTTVVHLQGGGEEGIGEDVTYDAAEHERLQARGPDLPVAGSWTLHSFSEHLAGQPLFLEEPDQPRYSRSRIMDESEAIRQKIQDALFDMLSNRQSVWFG